MVGRNHGTGSYLSRKTNFAYADGLVENKSVLQTLSQSGNAGGFEWGDSFYSLQPNDGLGARP